VILDKSLIQKAIELVTPGAVAILNSEGTTWGPKFAHGYVYAEESGAGDVEFHFGDITVPWDSKWGEQKDFAYVAWRKLNAAWREKKSTSEVVALDPWRLREKEFLYSGGAYRYGIAVGVSGALGRTDEALAEMVLSAIIMLARIEADKRMAEHRMEI